ncbi:unnamed protein product [Rotaria magnacalcarata]|uniref:Uncharacterized protein n=1 Tax=Rotaria magnacalcarata TaxID=392030 RepID=A0A816VZT9_9BILA|nr:unnamed protein product [Rotaria magnacalcarata]CAF2245923.1 unnamed protein product [Rotaria magnacalcarata]CAF3998361.1 unnamed protein product [Rotaria magnacalcarata]
MNRSVRFETPRNELRYAFLGLITLLLMTIVVVCVFVILHTMQRKPLLETDDFNEEYMNEIEMKIFNDCIEFVAGNLRLINSTQNYSHYLQEISKNVYNTLQHLSATYNHYLILYLYEHELIRSNIPFEKRLNLRDANLSNVQFHNIAVNHLYLPGVVALNSLFAECQLQESNFQGSMMDKSRFLDCSLENATFSGGSLKYSSFMNISYLSSVDFTNTDLLNSDIHIDWLGNTSNIIHARLPNGSFYNIDSRNLITDGGTEEKCYILQSDRWHKEPKDASSTIAHRTNNSCIEMTSMPENNCYFQVNSTGRFTQHIDLNRYSTLIDNNRAWYNLSVYLGCFNSSATVELHFANERESDLAYVINYGESWKLFLHNSSIPVGIRRAKIVIGAYIARSCCAIGDVHLNIFQNNE